MIEASPNHPLSESEAFVHTTTEFTTAEAATYLNSHLTHAWPGTDFELQWRNDQLTIMWKDGPLPDTVDRLLDTLLFDDTLSEWDNLIAFPDPLRVIRLISRPRMPVALEWELSASRSLRVAEAVDCTCAEVRVVSERVVATGRVTPRDATIWQEIENQSAPLSAKGWFAECDVSAEEGDLTALNLVDMLQAYADDPDGFNDWGTVSECLRSREGVAMWLRAASVGFPSPTIPAQLAKAAMERFTTLGNAPVARRAAMLRKVVGRLTNRENALVSLPTVLGVETVCDLGALIARVHGVDTLA